jgi:aspartate aminotransferase
MFDVLNPMPADSILGLSEAYKNDTHSDKVDLGVGVYRDESGNTPILASVKRAEALLIADQDSKAYINPVGDPLYVQGMQELIYGKSHPALLARQIASVQTPGGCGALRLGAELVGRANADTTVWMSNPSWANHKPLFGDAGLEIKEYPYYDVEAKGIDFDGMMNTLQQVGQGDLVLLHGCCHNPTGADLSQSQWQAVAKLAQDRGFTPFVDIAYQGFGEGLDEDAYGVRLLAESVPELVVAASCSKNFGLYRERAGMLSVLSTSVGQAQTAVSHALNLARGNYSMPPSHGPAIVGRLLNDETLFAQWQGEVTEMRDRMKGLRTLLVDQLAAAGVGSGFDHIKSQHGMFSFLGVNVDQVTRLREEFSVYMVNSSRINIAGISQNNIEYLAKAIAAVL